MYKTIKTVSLPKSNGPINLEANSVVNKRRVQDLIMRDLACPGTRSYFYVIEDDYMIDLLGSNKLYIPKLIYDQVEPDSKRTKEIFYQILRKKGCTGSKDEMHITFKKDKIFYDCLFEVEKKEFQKDKVLACIHEYWEIFYVFEEDYIEFINSAQG